MLFLVGLGLWDEKDISLRGIEAIKSCKKVYCELYTAGWKGNMKEIENMTGKKIKVIGREQVESDFLVKEAMDSTVALLVPGDPLAATTHFQLIADAKENGIETRVVHASSIYSAVAETGLSIYKFGRTTTLAAPEKNYMPESPYDAILENRKRGLHTLVLLDTKGKGMKIREAIEILEGIDEKRKGGVLRGVIVAAAKMGSGAAVIAAGGKSEIRKIGNTGILAIPGLLNANEKEALELWKKS